jgi:hypothetical protein
LSNKPTRSSMAVLQDPWVPPDAQTPDAQIQATSLQPGLCRTSYVYGDITHNATQQSRKGHSGCSTVSSCSEQLRDGLILILVKNTTQQQFTM